MADTLTNRVGRFHAQGTTTELIAALQAGHKSGATRARVLEYLYQQADHGATDVEIEAALRLNRPTGGNRRGELRDARLVAATDRTRPTATGSPARVWAITDRGRQVWDTINQQGAE